jgi:hypothetical protein
LWRIEGDYYHIKRSLLDGDADMDVDDLLLLGWDGKTRAEDSEVKS